MNTGAVLHAATRATSIQLTPKDILRAGMATGDLQANVVRLQSDLKTIKYPAELDVAG